VVEKEKVGKEKVKAVRDITTTTMDITRVEKVARKEARVEKVARKEAREVKVVRVKKEKEERKDITAKERTVAKARARNITAGEITRNLMPMTKREVKKRGKITKITKMKLN